MNWFVKPAATKDVMYFLDGSRESCKSFRRYLSEMLKRIKHTSEMPRQISRLRNGIFFS